MGQPNFRHYTPQEEVMATLNKLQNNYERLARGTTEKYNDRSPKEIYTEILGDLETVKRFAAERLGVDSNFSG